MPHFLSSKVAGRMHAVVLALLDIFGCALFAIAIHVFVAPNQIAPGGVSGLAVVLNYLTGISIGTWSFLLNIPLLLLALCFLGKRFTLKTLVSVAVLSFLLDYVAVYLPEYSGDALLAALFGGVLSGAGLAFVFMSGSTTGGSDILSRLLQKKHPHVSIGKILLVIDAVVIFISVIVFRRIETGLYGMVTVFSTSRVIDSVLYGADTGKAVYVMSPKAQEISEQVIAQIGRGCTLFKATGAFTKNDSQVLLVAVRRSQFYPLKQLVYQMDPEAFVIVTDCSEIIGKGFKPV